MAVFSNLAAVASKGAMNLLLGCCNWIMLSFLHVLSDLGWICLVTLACPLFKVTFNIVPKMQLIHEHMW